MNIIKKSALLLGTFTFVLSSVFFAFNSRADGNIPAVPTISQVVSVSNPFITGTTRTNTDVMVFIDNTFAGLANITGSDLVNEVSTFYYRYPSSSGYGPGVHKVYLIARDKNNIKLKSDPTRIIDISIPNLSAPVITKPTTNSFVTAEDATIKGHASMGSYVYVYVDNQLSGRIGPLTYYNGQDADFYLPLRPNYSFGWHNTYAISETKDQGQSLMSNIVTFRIEKKYPAPTLLKVTTNKNKTKPTITGLAKNNSKIKFYINQNFTDQIFINNDRSGTGNFSYTPGKNLPRGNNTIYATALDKRGKVSQKSNTLNFTILKPSITNNAANENVNITDLKKKDSDQDGLSDYNEIYVYKTNPYKSDTDGDGYPDKVELDNGYNPLVPSYQDKKKTRPLVSAKIVVKKNPPKTTKKNTTGQNKIAIITPQIPKETITVNTPQENTATSAQEKISTSTQNNIITAAITWLKGKNNTHINLIIFIVFICGIIAWIIWVNREIIKERKKKGIESNMENKSENDYEKDVANEPRLPL